MDKDFATELDKCLKYLVEFGTNKGFRKEWMQEEVKLNDQDLKKYFSILFADEYIEMVEHPNAKGFDFGLYGVTNKAISFYHKGGYSNSSKKIRRENTDLKFRVLRHYYWFWAAILSFTGNVILVCRLLFF